LSVWDIHRLMHLAELKNTRSGGHMNSRILLIIAKLNAYDLILGEQDPDNTIKLPGKISANAITA
jgi:hypothetical protein